MALGSAAPEIVINMIAVVRSIGDKGDPEAIQLGVSAVLGSGIVSFLLSTGVCAFYAPGDLVLKRRPLLRDAGSYLIMMILLIIFFDDGVIHVMEAATLVILYFVYLPIVAFSGRIRQWWRVNMQGKQLRKKVSFVHAAAGGLDEEDDELLGADDEDEVEGGQMEMGSINNGERTSSKVTFKDGDGHSDSDGSDGDDDDDDEEDEELGPFLHFMSAPLRFCFEWTCPDAAEGAKYETWYPVTAIVSFIWIAIFSFLLSSPSPPFRCVYASVRIEPTMEFFTTMCYTKLAPLPRGLSSRGKSKQCNRRLPPGTRLAARHLCPALATPCSCM